LRRHTEVIVERTAKCRVNSLKLGSSPYVEVAGLRVVQGLVRKFGPLDAFEVQQESTEQGSLKHKALVKFVKKRMPTWPAPSTRERTRFKN
jgi:hypothetical protein